MARRPVPEWKKELLAKKASGPPKILQDPAPEKWRCDCDEEQLGNCFCCPWGDWPTCYNCNSSRRSGVYFYKSHDPTTKQYYCTPCFEKASKQ